MHYSCLVIVPMTAADDIDAAVKAAMEPYDENVNRSGFWDWYQIGGRWMGSLDGYDPETDPNNKEPVGRVKWPTLWKRRDGDIQPVENVPTDFVPHTFIDSDGRASHRSVWSGMAILTDEKWEEHYRKALGHEFGNLAVIVDYHS
jgi:hypothetical protein